MTLVKDTWTGRIGTASMSVDYRNTLFSLRTADYHAQGLFREIPSTSPTKRTKGTRVASRDRRRSEVRATGERIPPQAQPE